MHCSAARAGDLRAAGNPLKGGNQMGFKQLKRGAFAALFLCLLAAMISGMAVQASAVKEVDLPHGLLIGDQDGIAVDEHGYYYIDARGLLPGEVVRKVLTVQNLEYDNPTPESKVAYIITLAAEPLFSRGPVDLLDKVHMEIKLEGKIIYDGKVRGDGTPNMIETPLDLGTYAIGDRRVLDITLTVAPDMEIHEEKSEADFRWHFYAARIIDSPAPRTGVLDNYGYLFPVGGVLLLFFLLIPLKKRKDREKAG